MPHLGGKTSKISKDLANIQTQLKSGKTRGNNPRELSPGEITDLEHQRDSLRKQIQDNAKNRITTRVNSHTTNETERVIACVQETTVPAQQYFTAIGGAGSSTDLRVQAKTLIERANAMDRESKKAAQEQQKAEQKAIKDAQRKADTEKRKADAEKRKAEKRKAASKQPNRVQKRRVNEPSQQLELSSFQIHAYCPCLVDTCPDGASSAAQKAAIEDKFLADLDDEEDSNKCPF